MEAAVSAPEKQRDPSAELKQERTAVVSDAAALGSRQIAIRLGVAFGLLVAIMMVVGDQGLRRMDQLNQDLEDIVGHLYVKLRLAREAQTLSNRNSRITMQVFMMRNAAQIQSLLASRAENSARIVVLLNDLENRCSSDDERRLLKAVQSGRSKYYSSYQEALSLLVKQRQYAAAAQVMVDRASPELIRYQAAWDDFVRFEGDQMEQAAQESRMRNLHARRIALVSTAFAVLFGGGIAFVVIKRLVSEVTARLRKEREALWAAHHDAEVFIDAVPSILIGLDRDSRITRWNMGAERVFGLVQADVKGRPLATCGIQWQRSDMTDEVEAWSSSGLAARCEQAPFERNGETRLLGLTITPVHVSDEDFTKLLVIGSDTTNRKNLEAQLRQAQKLESVGQLAAGIAHEINTPTQYIGDNVRFLKDAFQDLQFLLAKYEQSFSDGRNTGLTCKEVEDLSAAVKDTDTDFLREEIPKAIDQTLEGVSRVSGLVSAMKDFSHPGTKERILMDLNRAIQSTITVARNEWKYVADIETDYDASLPMISCLPGEFNQVILNLIVNAAHAIDDVIKTGAIEKGKITVQTRNFEQWVEIRIQDTGAGIPEDVRSRIFDPFFTTKEIGKGTGQGLAIARSVIVDKHEGSIDFETEVGKGTTFVIHLPHYREALAVKAGSS